MKDYQIFLEQNPWWKGKEEIHKDYDILRWKEKPIRWKPKITEKVNYPYLTHFVREEGTSLLSLST